MEIFGGKKKKKTTLSTGRSVIRLTKKKKNSPSLPLRESRRFRRYNGRRLSEIVTLGIHDFYSLTRFSIGFFFFSPGLLYYTITILILRVLKIHIIMRIVK